MKNKENQFSFEDSDKSSKNSSEKPIRKRIQVVGTDDKEMISMKKAYEAKDYEISTFKRQHVFEDSPEI